MNRKLEDRLLRLSFGDLTSEEAHEVQKEAASNPEAQRLLREYASLRSDLQLLKSIPDEQLSNERLREAILTRGLKPKTESSSLRGWIWAPATAALLAFAIVNFKSRPASPFPSVGMVGKFEAPAVGAKDAAPDFVSTLSSEKPLALKAPAPAAPALASIPSPTWNSTMVAEVKSPRDSSMAYRGGGRAHERLKDISERIERSLVHKNELALAPPSPIVLITNDPDQDTGAKKATEVDNSNDVVISG